MHFVIWVNYPLKVSASYQNVTVDVGKTGKRVSYVIMSGLLDVLDDLLFLLLRRLGFCGRCRLDLPFRVLLWRGGLLRVLGWFLVFRGRWKAGLGGGLPRGLDLSW